MVQAWFKLGSGLAEGLFQAWVRLGLRLVQAWFRLVSGFAQVWLRGLVEARFRFGSGLVKA